MGEGPLDFGHPASDWRRASVRVPFCCQPSAGSDGDVAVPGPPALKRGRSIEVVLTPPASPAVGPSGVGHGVLDDTPMLSLKEDEEGMAGPHPRSLRLPYLSLSSLSINPSICHFLVLFTHAVVTQGGRPEAQRLLWMRRRGERERERERESAQMTLTSAEGGVHL